MADPAVDVVGDELDALRLERRAGGRDVVDLERDRVRVGRNSRPNASDCMIAIVTVPFSYSPAGMSPQRLDRSRPSTSP